jgi:aldehyde:ferredoxin oxidoreductase
MSVVSIKEQGVFMKILRINTRTKSFKFEELGDLAGLGGRALTSRVVNREVPANCHPLSADNKLIFAAGVLAPTNAANSGRVSVGSKSPLTGGIKESNSGGQFAHTLPKLGLLAIILEDKPEAGSPMQELFITERQGRVQGFRRGRHAHLRRAGETPGRLR